VLHYRPPCVSPIKNYAGLRQLAERQRRR